MSAPDLSVQVLASSRAEVLAVVTEADGTEVRVRIRNRRHAPPRWLCDMHPDPAGRTACEHTQALAETRLTPEQLAAIRGRHNTHKKGTEMTHQPPGEPHAQLDRDALKGMSAAEIVDAKSAGRLDVLMGTATPDEAALLARAGTGTLTRADVQTLSRFGSRGAALIASAQTEGRITATTEENRSS